MTKITLDSPSTINTASINLTHLLDRLNAKLASFADIKPLLRSEYHRARVAANIQYAQQLLQDLERACGTNVSKGAGHYLKSATTSVAATATAATTVTAATATAVPSAATALQSDLASQRQKLSELAVRFAEIEERAAIEADVLEARLYDNDDDDDEDEVGDGDGEEEIIVPTPDESDEDGTPIDEEGEKPSVKEEEEEEEEEVVDEPTRTRKDGKETEIRLRNRRAAAAAAAKTAAPPSSSAMPTVAAAITTSTTAASAPATATATDTSTATATGRSHSKTAAAATPSIRSMQDELFRSRTSVEPSLSDIQDTEGHLSRDRAEQETLTTSLLQLVTQLKESTQNFASSLEGEKGILARAVEGLDRNISGMESATGQMGVVRRMAEGKGWWDRMLLYGMIFGLWVVVILMVFVAPKLRI